MIDNWASETDIDDDVIEKVQATLTVDMIMTPRKGLSCCKPTDNAEEIISSNTNGYSTFPVVDEHDRIIGIFRADEPMETSGEAGITVCSKMQALSEELLIGAKDRIIDYVKDCVSRPIQLVVSDRRVVGLATPSDLQQLPVRVILFSLITSLEIAMAKLIEAKWPGPGGYDCWHKFLSPCRKVKIDNNIMEAKRKEEDQFVREILYTYISDKRDIISKENLLGLSSTKLGKIFKPIITLRDNLSHANDYANTEQKASQLPDTIRSIIDVKDKIVKAAKEINSQS